MDSPVVMYGNKLIRKKRLQYVGVKIYLEATVLAMILYEWYYTNIYTCNSCWMCLLVALRSLYEDSEEETL